MTVVAIRIPDEVIERLDDLVHADAYATRTEVIRRAIDVLLDAHERSVIDREIMDSYAGSPQTDEEVAIAAAAARALIEKDPW